MRLLYGARGIAAATGLTPRQAYTMLDRGLPHFKTGRTIIARADAVDDWLKRQEAKARQAQHG